MKAVATHIDKNVYKAALKFINYKVRNLEDAKDIAQISLSKAYFNESKLKDKTKFNSWLYKIMMREIVRYRKFNYVPLELVDVGINADIGFIDTDFLFSRLSNLHRKFMWLVVYGYSHKEIKKLTGIKNTRSLKHTIVKKLME